jgi:hypothetical protein
MPGSSTSLGSLTTPSPSPPPQREQPRHIEPSGAGLDGDSELSELTDEEQEGGEKLVKRKSPSSSSSGDNPPHSSQPTRRFTRGKKRSSIVPAPMWGWVAPASQNEEESPSITDSPVPEASKQGVDSPFLAASAMAALANAPSSSTVAGAEPDINKVGDPLAAVVELAQVATAALPLETGAQGAFTASKVTITDAERESDAEEEGQETGQLSPISADNVSEEESAEEDEEDDNNRPIPPRDASPESESGDDGELDPPRPEAEDSGNELEVDITAPPPNAIQPLVAAAAQSSIMSGAEVIVPPSPTSSSASEASRSPSPPPKPPKSPLTDKSKKPVRELQVNTDKLAASDAENEVIEAVRDRLVEDTEPDAPSPVEDIDVELESDLQPAHRAEALDGLAIIELKFAQLRERIYVEKMEALSWEEDLVEKGMEFYHSLLPFHTKHFFGRYTSRTYSFT